MDKAMAEELESKHAALHALIEEEEHRAHPDEDLLHRLKKEKLTQGRNGRPPHPLRRPFL